MVDITVQPALTASHIEDGYIALVRGGAVIGTVLLADISGNKWNAKRLERLTLACQTLMDHRRLRADLAPDDFDLLMALSETAKTDFSDFYGGRMFLESDAIVSRSDLISFTLVDGDLVPHLRVVL